MTDASGASRSTVKQYLWQTSPQGANYFQANILDPVGTVTVADGSGVQAALTTYGYDENNGSPQGYFGLNTSVTQWLDQGVTSPKSSTVYNAQGMPTSKTDPLLTATAIQDYTCGGLFPQTVVRAYKSLTVAPETTTYAYDCNTGHITGVTDPNGSKATYGYDDPLGRIKLAKQAVGTPAESWTVYGYPTSTTITVVQDLSAPGDGLLARSLSSDGLGNTIQKTAANGAATHLTYDYNGNVTSVSNPYFGAAGNNQLGTSFTYDALGRKRLQCNADNGTGPGACAAGVSYQQWTYAGNQTTFRDETAQSWTRTADALGRLTNVVEPNGASTGYIYDALNNLKTVMQTGVSGDTVRTRGFTYDSLSRLLTSNNPETGTVCYGVWNGPTSDPKNCVNGYDGNGNLQYKTDARGVVTNYSYDALNRLLSKTYTNDTSGALASCYQYDTLSAGGTNLVGRLTAEWTQKLASGASCPSTMPSGVMTSRTLSAYDAMGRVTSETQCVGASCTKDYSTSPTYTYDLAGNLTLYGNLLGTARFTNGYDSAGRLKSLTDAWTGAQQVAPFYPSSLFSADTTDAYTPAGQLSHAIYGAGLDLKRTYDSRLRVTGEIDMGSPGSGPATPGKAVISITGGVQAK